MIASITGADLALVVTEPTPSGFHDMERVLELTDHFHIPAVVCINKYDLNMAVSATIEECVRQRGQELAGRIRYDPAVSRAQVAGQSLAEFASGGAATDIESVWHRVSALLQNHD